MGKWCCIPLGLSINGDDRDCLLDTMQISCTKRAGFQGDRKIFWVTAKGLQSIFRVTARVTPTIHGALHWFVFELVIDYGIFNSQLWGERPWDGFAKGFAAYDPFSLCTSCVSRYSPHHGFLFAILSG